MSVLAVKAAVEQEGLQPCRRATDREHLVLDLGLTDCKREVVGDRLGRIRIDCAVGWRVYPSLELYVRGAIGPIVAHGRPQSDGDILIGIDVAGPIRDCDLADDIQIGRRHRRRRPCGGEGVVAGVRVRDAGWVVGQYAHIRRGELDCVHELERVLAWLIAMDGICLREGNVCAHREVVDALDVRDAADGAVGWGVDSCDGDDIHIARRPVVVDSLSQDDLDVFAHRQRDRALDVLIDDLDVSLVHLEAWQANHRPDCT